MPYARSLPSFRHLSTVLVSVLIIFILATLDARSQLVHQWLRTADLEMTSTKINEGIHACDALHYIASGERHGGLEGAILVSDDGGRNWRTALSFPQYPRGSKPEPYQRPFNQQFVTSVVRPEPGVCMAAGYGTYDTDGIRYPFLLRSSDAGATWIEIGLPDSALGVSSPLISMKDAMHGVRTGGYVDEQTSVLYLTQNGGLDWTPVPIPFTDYRIRNLQFAADGTLFALEWRTPPSLFRSTDIGSNWDHRGSPPLPSKPFFHSTELGWLAGGVRIGAGDTQRDVVYKTTDGGSTWSCMLDSLIEPAFGLLHIRAADDQHLIAVGRLSKILHSSNGGSDWVLAPHPYHAFDPSIKHLAYPHPASAVAGSIHRVITFTGDWTLQPPKPHVRAGTQTLDRSIHWPPIKGASWYELQLAEDFHSSTLKFEIFDQQAIRKTGWIADTSVKVSSWLRNNRDYFVRVRARGGADTSDWSHPIKFVTDGATDIANPPAIPSMAMRVSPQPAYGQAMVELHGLHASDTWELRVYSTLGALLHVERGHTEATGVTYIPLRLKHCPSGVLLVQCISPALIQMIPLLNLR